ncbi:MAG: four helix bundle protein [Planctomycetota bacterium]
MTRPRFASSASWRSAMRLAVWVHRLSRRLPAEEQSGLAASLRRSAVAATQQIADADGRPDDGEAAQRYAAALASLRELGTAGLLCRRLKYIRGGRLRDLQRRIAKVVSRVESDRCACASQTSRRSEGHRPKLAA